MTLHTFAPILFAHCNSDEESLFNLIPVNLSGFSVSNIIVYEFCLLKSISVGDTEVIIVFSIYETVILSSF